MTPTHDRTDPSAGRIRGGEGKKRPVPQKSSGALEGKQCRAIPHYGIGIA